MLSTTSVKFLTLPPMTSSWEKLTKYRCIGKSMVRWLEKSLNELAWGAVISDAKSGWRSITSEVPQ